MNTTRGENRWKKKRKQRSPPPPFSPGVASPGIFLDSTMFDNDTEITSMHQDNTRGFFFSFFLSLFSFWSFLRAHLQGEPRPFPL